MFSQSLTAQLLRMLVFLGISLAVVHHSPSLLNSLAHNAVNAGCHQGGGEHHTMSHRQHSEHHH